jgi:hypothetical protein
MVLWSIRNPSELEVIRIQGRLITDASLIDPDYVAAYNWMASELNRRVKRPCSECRHPVWLWKCWDSERRCRPDLRLRWGKKNEELVLLKLVIPDDLLLLSDYHLWHYALNKWYLPVDAKDEKCFKSILRQKKIREEWPLPEPYDSIVIDSWKRMFSWDHPDIKYHGSTIGTSIQAVSLEIRDEWVSKVRHFK